MSGYPVDNEYLHNEEQYGKGSSIGGDRSNSDLLSVMAGAGAVAFTVILSIVFPVFGIPMLIIWTLVALGKMSEMQDDFCNKRKRKQRVEVETAKRDAWIQAQMPALKRRPMDEMF